MRELTVAEIESVSGGVSFEDGAVMILGLAATATIAGAPFAAGFGAVIGGAMLYTAYFG